MYKNGLICAVTAGLLLLGCETPPSGEHAIESQVGAANTLPDDGPPELGNDVVKGVFDAAEPGAAYQALSPEDRRVFDDTLRAAETTLAVRDVRSVAPTKLDLDQAAEALAADGANDVAGADEAVAPAAVRCWTSEAKGNAKNRLGKVLYTFWVDGHWCASGSRVTSARVTYADGETKTIGWRYDGVKSKGAGISSNVARMWAKQRFILGVGGIDIQSPDECLRLNGTAAPRTSAEYKCGIF